MINVYSGSTTTFNNNGLATLIPLSCEISVGINGAWQLELEHPFDKEQRYKHLVKDAILRVTNLDFIGEWESNTQLFRIYDTKKTLTSITVIAFPIALEATYDAPIQYLNIDDETGAQAATTLDNYVKTVDANNKYTISSNITFRTWGRWNNTNLIAAISGSDDNSFVNHWGGEVIYDSYKIKILDIIGDQNNARAYPIRYGRNLMGLTYEVDTSSVVTRLYPISKEGIRLNTWADVPDQGGNQYVDTARQGLDYPFVRSRFLEINTNLIDTDKTKNDYLSNKTEQWRVAMTDAMTATAEAIWTAIVNDTTNTYKAEYVKTLISGEGGLSEYLQNKFVFTIKSWQSFVKSCAKNSVSWISKEKINEWEWHENTSVIPHAWWYGDDSETPAKAYAKNCYIKIGKEYYYFNNDGYWEDYKNVSDMGWYQSQENGKWWYGNRERYYAHNEYVFMTVEGTMRQWWYDEEGWYDEDSSGESNYGWHGDASSGYWFGEEGASADDKSKYLHDRWAFIDGTYYWFDQYGYTDADPAHSMPDYPWGDLVDEQTGKHWFGNTDKDLGMVYLKSQWMKIDNEWRYFDSDGYLVDMDAKKSETIAWLADEIYTANIALVKAKLTEAYEELYDFMTGQCEYFFEDEGWDLPTVNVTADLIDLSKTAEYKAYRNLERIHLGDKVELESRDGERFEERVVGLTYDCIRGYNTKVEVGQLSKTVGQIVSTNYKGSGSEQRLIAGDNVVIEGNIISVADYVGRAIGLQDVLLNGSTCVSGNVASFGIAAGNNITISRDGNTLTINSTGGDGDVNLYHGIPTPSDSLGDDDDIYIQLAPDPTSFETMQIGGGYNGVKSWTMTDVNKVYHYQSVWQTGYMYHAGQGIIFQTDQLTAGKRYILHLDAISDNGVWNSSGDRNQGEFYGIAYQKQNNIVIHDGRTTEHVSNGGFEYLSQYGSGIYYQSFVHDHKRHTYEFEFEATQQGYLMIYGDDFADSEEYNLEITNMYITDGEDELAIITNIYYKIEGEWLLNESGKIYEAGDNIQISDDDVISATDTTYTAGTNIQISEQNVISATDTDEIAELEDVSLTNLADGEILKYNATTQKWENAEESGGSEVEANPSGTATATLTKLGVNGTIYGIQGGGGGGSNLIVDAQIYSLEEKQIGVWVDGRPLYQKTFIRNITLASGSWVTTGDSILNGKAIDAEITKIDQISDTVPVWCEIGADGHIELLNIRNTGQVTITHYTVRYFKTTDTAGSGGFQAYGFTPIIYSTEEREVGVWTDGKPLYQKTVFSTTTPSQNNWTTIQLNLPSDAVVKKYEAYYSRSPNRTDFIPQYNPTGSNEWLFGALSNNNFVYKVGSPYVTNFLETYITVWYTKTTDTAGSASYTTLGIPAHHYDGNEKVVGTWFGETLYEKTVTTGGAVPSGATLVERQTQVGYDTILYTKTS